ncbi:hypothetical protein NPIL_590961 [Nephila pilipes]|uniref:Uncharacterized protein n=1 Tax=Nephila pilipes TaxID=299642 RepID=A0A8X6M8U8_NEPPI|nr:hypothetical protein NPIL_590961 [Nephila pilipes]
MKKPMRNAWLEVKLNKNEVHNLKQVEIVRLLPLQKERQEKNRSKTKEEKVVGGVYKSPGGGRKKRGREIRKRCPAVYWQGQRGEEEGPPKGKR